MMLKTTEWDKQFPHFAPEEYFSPEGLVLFHKNIMPCDPAIVDSLEYLRASLNHARETGMVTSSEEIQLVINHGMEVLRGFITPGEWVALRSKLPDQVFSYHLWCAADVHSPQLSNHTLFHFAKKYRKGVFTGIIKYHWGLHLDLRPGGEYTARRAG